MRTITWQLSGWNTSSFWRCTKPVTCHLLRNSTEPQFQQLNFAPDWLRTWPSIGICTLIPTQLLTQQRLNEENDLQKTWISPHFFSILFTLWAYFCPLLLQGKHCGCLHCNEFRARDYLRTFMNLRSRLFWEHLLVALMCERALEKLSQLSMCELVQMFIVLPCECRTECDNETRSCFRFSPPVFDFTAAISSSSTRLNKFRFVKAKITQANHWLQYGSKSRVS